VIDSLGIMIYKALDFGLKESEERELSPPLERLIDMMTNAEEAESDPCPDEGYEATEEEEEEEEEGEEGEGQEEPICSAHLPSPSDAPNHYQAVCRALYAESRELSTFLDKIKSAKEVKTSPKPAQKVSNLKPKWAERRFLPSESPSVNGNIPPRLKKSAHEIILEFIRSRPPLNPSPVGAGKSISTPQDLFRSSDSPDARRKLAGSTHSLTAAPPGSAPGGPPLSQRKRLLRAPTLAELDSSESDFLPMSATPQPDRRPSPPRRHSIEKEAPTSGRPFAPPSRQTSKSLEEFCYPAECLALTVEEVMHIRQVLVKAELEKFQQYKDVYNALKKGKVESPETSPPLPPPPPRVSAHQRLFITTFSLQLCFSCRAKKFSLFTWAYTCQFCKR
ncbi:unnamed protein product, partial [Menidia menidia]